jgi:hypothetical protein
LLPEEVFEVLKMHRVLQDQERLKAGTNWRESGLMICNRRGGFVIGEHMANQSLLVLLLQNVAKCE